MADSGVLTTAVKLRRVEAVINPLAGSVGVDALSDMQATLAEFGLTANVEAVQPTDLSKALDRALSCDPDLLIILAGDGTARAACELAGETGPLVAPLPGGTMNILPKALYGARDWKAALTDSLTHGVERSVSGGSMGGRRFYVGAMLGWPALWARAREAARERRLDLTLRRARFAWQRAFTGHIYFSLDGRAEERTQALTLLCPLVSRRMERETALEIGALNPSGLAEAARVGARALIGDTFGELLGNWREDPAVDMGYCRHARARSRTPIPAYIDGEPVRMGSIVDIDFHPKAFRALTPADENPKTA